MKLIQVQIVITQTVLIQTWRVRYRTKMVLRFLLFIMLIHVISEPLLCGTEEQTEKLPHPFIILPHPKQTEMIKGKGLEAGQLRHLKLSGELERPAMRSILSRLTESELPEPGILTLRLGNSDSIPESDEGYVLYISNGDAEIISRGEAGLFYGCQTLEQLLEDCLPEKESFSPG